MSLKSEMLSVKELNEIIIRLQNSERLSYLGVFSQVDIVFVAGLFLWYKQHEANWTKIPYFFDISENANAYNHSHYFKQIEELYKIKHNDIFTNFINAQNQYANSVSRFFAPPIYITNESIIFFFGTQIETDPQINKLKSKYAQTFDLLEFVDTRFREYFSNKKDYEEYATSIRQRLYTASPIFVFTFIVTCTRLSQKEKRTFEKTKEYVEKIWHFTQTYVNGLYELAKNIVEHSGEGENDGKGMITIRAYSESEIDKTKVLETHIFDYGRIGIIPKLKKYTGNQVQAYNHKTGLSTNQINVRNAYIKDLNENLNENFVLNNFILGRILEQQNFRHIGHYGINKLYSLIQKPLEGNIYISSKGINGQQDYFNRDIENLTLETGTHYFIKIPFIPENFGKLTVSMNIRQEFSTLGSSDALQKLMQKNVKTIQLNELNDINLDDFTEVLDITVNKRIDKKFVDDIYLHFSKLSLYNRQFIIALNLEDCFEINAESTLLRFLGCLTYEYNATFIIYNLEFEVYKKMIDDNTEFAKTRNWESFWHESKGMLVYTKTRNKNFYFADILYGKTANKYYSVNKSLSHTFPNSASIVDINTQQAQQDKTIFLSDFFNNNALLPYDIIFKKQNKELALYNIETILQNNLFHNELNANISDYTAEKILENYVDNFDGYHIINTHFKIGNKIHSSDFYYAKRLFQNSFYTTRLAMSLAKQITEQQETRPIVLVGYEMYSELILSLTSNFLKEIYKSKEVKHFVARSKDDKIEFLPQDIFSHYIKEYEKKEAIIIVPIAATSSTSQKIEKEIRKQIYKQERINGCCHDVAEQKKNDKSLFQRSFNIIVAQDSHEQFKDIRNDDNKQKSIINLDAKWHKLDKCELCYGAGKKSLFDTDNSSLTPSLIFGKPEGLTKQDKEFKNTVVEFDNLLFDGTIGYKTVARNDNYRIYDVDSDRFIEKNNEKITDWLKKVKDDLEQKNDLKSTDNIIIVAPCHESNSKFISLINEYVFSSSATIIYHQRGVDYKENFGLMNKNYLSGKDAKVFYVDDSLITGSTFFEIYDLIKKTDTKIVLTASILLNDQTEPFVHNRAVELSKNYYVFATYNQPPALNILARNPLEYEHKRYEVLMKSTLHDTLKEHFYKKAQKINPENTDLRKDEIPEKRIRRLKMFEATHKIYDYYTLNKSEPDLITDNERNKFVDFKLKFNIADSYIDIKDTDNKILMKVLSQYPFVFYQDLRNSVFDWHKTLLGNDELKPTDIFIIDQHYNNFQTFKFLLRRASFLSNYQVLEKPFLLILLSWFITNDKYFKSKTEQQENATPNNIGNGLFDEIDNKKNKQAEDNLRDFPVFVLGNYVEMIQKNSWVAYHILKAIKDLGFQNSTQGVQFYNMLQIEAASIIDEFTKMINQEYGLSWIKLYKDIPSDILYKKTDRIVIFLKNNIKELEKTNKYSVIKEAFLEDGWLNENKPFINYLWIKQLLCADSIIDKKIKISYQDEINEIIVKMKGFFDEKEKIQAFFIVTDGQQNPYVMFHDNYILNEFIDEFETSKVNNHNNNNLKTKIIIDFLNGEKCNIGNATETTAEFVFDQKQKEWQNIYTNNTVQLDFMTQKSEWLYLIRISKLEKYKNGNCFFETQGLLGFYSQNYNNQFFPKQLLMLLRKDISTFINNHHRNNEFSELIRQREKNKYVLRLNHGIRDYKSSIEEIVNKCTDADLKDELLTFYDYLIVKLDIIDKLNSENTTIEEISLQTIKDEFCNKYKNILSLNVAGVEGLKKNEITNLVKLKIFEGCSNLDTKYYFPESCIKDIVFELLNNIRKNVCFVNKYLIKSNNPLEIEIAVIYDNGNQYLSVKNNHVRDLNPHRKMEDIPHGIDLLRQMWRAFKLGKIITPDYPLREYSFTIKIQLNEIVKWKKI